MFWLVDFFGLGLGCLVWCFGLLWCWGCFGLVAVLLDCCGCGLMGGYCGFDFNSVVTFIS